MRCPHPSGGVPHQQGSGQSFTLARTARCWCFSPVCRPDFACFSSWTHEMLLGEDLIPEKLDDLEARMHKKPSLFAP